MTRFQITTAEWANDSGAIDAALASTEIKTLRRVLDQLEVANVYPTHIIVADAYNEPVVGYVIVRLNANGSDEVLAAEVANGYEDSGILEDLMKRTEALIWMETIQRSMKSKKML